MYMCYNPPSFIGNDFFCESGNPINQWTIKLYTNDPLWDGEDWSNENAHCCKGPWFNKVVGTATTD